MRAILVLSSIAGVIGTLRAPDHMTMVNFVGCECLSEDLDEPRTELFDALSGSIHTLYEWYQLDKASFMEKARRPALVAHRGTLRDVELASTFQRHLDHFASKGLSPDETLTVLLEKYYDSLHRKRAMIEMANSRK